MVYDSARALARQIRTSQEYKDYKQAKDKAFENETTKALVERYHALQVQVQSSMMSGTQNEVLMAELKKVGEILQFNPDASEYLIAEYRLGKMLADVYKILADAAEMDLSMLG